jgi:hypothetical protein
MKGRVNRWRDRWKRSLVIMRAPRVRIAMYGDDEALAAYRAFTARHPRFRMTSAKRWGVALVSVPDSFDDYATGSAKAYLRRQIRRAEKAGYRFTPVNPNERIDEILEINQSAPSRQGRAMAESYVDRNRVIRTFLGRSVLHGILDSSGRLRAYADVRSFGDVIVLSLILGHTADLEHGTMYLLVSEVIRDSVGRRGASTRPLWVMYDMFWGASPGLAYFKERCGFLPYTVEWVWIGSGPALHEH